jgi:hypothetical protein
MTGGGRSVWLGREAATEKGIQRDDWMIAWSQGNIPVGAPKGGGDSGGGVRGGGGMEARAKWPGPEGRGKGGRGSGERSGGRASER